MTKRVLLIVLTMALLCLGITDASAIKNGNSKWALHYAGAHNPSANTCVFTVTDCVGDVVTEGPGSAGRYDIYLMAFDTDGMAGTRYGLCCEPPGAFYFYGWTSCCDLWLPTGSIWPGHGEGVMQAWPIEHPPGHVTLGILDVYVAGHTSPRICMCDDPWGGGNVEMCDGTQPTPICVYRTVAGTPAAFGCVAFGSTSAYGSPDGFNSNGGYNPCGIIQTENRTWGSLKALYR